MPLGISEVCRRIEPSATLAIDAKAKALCAAGENVIGFGAGEPDFDTPEPIRIAMKEALDKGLTRYTPVPGTVSLRQTIAQKLLRDNDLVYPIDQIIVSNGAKHSLSLILQTILDIGDEVIIPTPCWVSYPEMVRMAGGVPVFVEGSEAEGFVPSVDKIVAAVTAKTKGFILTSPSNPNGCIWQTDTLQALADLAVSKDFYVISDEIYEKLIYDGYTHRSIATFGEEIKQRTLLVNGVSKTYAMTGFRIGYTAGPKDVIQAMSNYQSQATSAPNTPAQYAAEVALSMPQDSVENMRKAFEGRRNRLVEGICAIQGLSCLKPEGAFYVMMNMKELLGKKLGDTLIENSNDFAAALLDSQHVAVVPGSAFMAEGYCRLSYAVSDEDIAEGLRRIAVFADALK